jgi:hypothetical protein
VLTPTEATSTTASIRAGAAVQPVRRAERLRRSRGEYAARTRPGMEPYQGPRRASSSASATTSRSETEDAEYSARSDSRSSVTTAEFKAFAVGAGAAERPCRSGDRCAGDRPGRRHRDRSSAGRRADR